MNRKRFVWIVCAIAAGVVLLASVAGYRQGYRSGFHLGRVEGRQAGADERYREWSRSGGDPSFSAQIRDARRRWNARNNRPPNQVDPDRVALVMAFSDRVCVQLKLGAGSIGASPIYCYRGESTELLRADDVGE